MVAEALTRRLFILEAAALAARPAAAQAASERLIFQVFRNDAHVGEHEMRFSRVGGVLSVATNVAMTIRLGRVPVFRYRHEAQEEWRDGAFAKLRTTTSSNGQKEQVTAASEAGAVWIETLKGRMKAPSTAAPLTHWNTAAFDRPLFNPQTGRMLKVSLRRTGGSTTPSGVPAADAWAIRGEATIDNWYDGTGDWLALRGQLPDRSWMEYRRS